MVLVGNVHSTTLASRPVGAGTGYTVPPWVVVHCAAVKVVSTEFSPYPIREVAGREEISIALIQLVGLFSYRYPRAKGVQFKEFLEGAKRSWMSRAMERKANHSPAFVFLAAC